MIKKILHTLFFSLCLCGIMILCDVCFFDGLGPFWGYFIQTLGFFILYPIAVHLDEKGWNSWKKVGNLFKRKKQ